MRKLIFFELVLLALLIVATSNAKVRFLLHKGPSGGTGTGTLAVTLRASNPITTDGTVYTSSSFTPSANSLIVATFSSIRGSSSDPNVVTVTDSGSHTWTQIKEFAYVSSGTNKARIAIYATSAGGSPTSMTVTGTYGGNINGCAIKIFDVTGTDVANGVAGCFVQSPTTTANVSGTSASVTLSAAGNSHNRAFLVTAHYANESTTEATSWTEIADDSFSNPSYASQVQWRSDIFDTAASATWTTSSSYGAVALEIKAQ